MGPQDNPRRRFLTVATCVVGGGGAAVPFIASWNPSAKAKAAGADVEVDISAIEPGQLIRVRENSSLDIRNKGHRRAVSLTTNIPKESSKILTSSSKNLKNQISQKQLQNQSQKINQTNSSISNFTNQNNNSANLFDRKISEEPNSGDYSDDEFYDALEEFRKNTPSEIYRLVE